MGVATWLLFQYQLSKWMSIIAIASVHSWGLRWHKLCSSYRIENVFVDMNTNTNILFDEVIEQRKNLITRKYVYTSAACTCMHAHDKMVQGPFHRDSIKHLHGVCGIITKFMDYEILWYVQFLGGQVTVQKEAKGTHHHAVSLYASECSCDCAGVASCVRVQDHAALTQPYYIRHLHSWLKESLIVACMCMVVTFNKFSQQNVYYTIQCLVLHYAGGINQFC